MDVQAEVSLYPIGGGEPLRPILAFVERLRAAGLKVEPGPLSTWVGGPCERVFGALEAAFQQTAAEGRCVLVVKVVAGRRPPSPS